MSLYHRLLKNLVVTEVKWVRHTEDLAALAPDSEHGWFNDFLEDMLSRISKKALVVSSGPLLSVPVPSIQCDTASENLTEAA